MLFNLTTDKLSLVTNEAGDVDVVVSYIDRVTSTGAVGAAAHQLTNITTATTTDILAVPGADTERKLEQLTIRNAHASTSMDVTVQFNANGTLYELHAARLYPTELLEWNEQTGWKKTSKVPAKACSIGIVNSNEQNNSATATATSPIQPTMKVPVSPSADKVRTVGLFSAYHHTSAISTTGFMCGFRVHESISLAFARETKIQVSTNSVTAAVLNCFSRATLSTTPLDSGTSVTGVSLGVMAGGFQFTESLKRDLLVSFIIGSEVAASAVTLNPGSWFELFEATE